MGQAILIGTNSPNVLRAYVLYSDETGTKGNITLNDSSANYKYLEAYYYADQNHILSSKVCDPDGNSIILQMVGYYGNSFAVRSAMYNISGTTLTLSTDDSGYGFIHSSSIEIHGESNPFFVTKILGYK